jgi:hypothetical protein
MLVKIETFREIDRQTFCQAHAHPLCVPNRRKLFPTVMHQEMVKGIETDA